MVGERESEGERSRERDQVKGAREKDKNVGEEYKKG